MTKATGRYVEEPGGLAHRVAQSMAAVVLDAWPGSVAGELQPGNLGALSEKEATAFATALVGRLAHALTSGIRPPAELLDECTALIAALPAAAHPGPAAVAKAWNACRRTIEAPALLGSAAQALAWSLARSGDPAVRDRLRVRAGKDPDLLAAVDTALSEIAADPSRANIAPWVSAAVGELSGATELGAYVDFSVPRSRHAGGFFSQQEAIEPGRGFSGVVGRNVYDRTGRSIGLASNLYLDNSSGAPKWVTVRTGAGGATESIVPFHGADVTDEGVRVFVTEDQVNAAPQILSPGRLSLRETEELLQYYDVPTEGVAAAPSGNRVLSIQEDEETHEVTETPPAVDDVLVDVASAGPGAPRTPGKAKKAPARTAPTKKTPAKKAPAKKAPARHAPDSRGTKAVPLVDPHRDVRYFNAELEDHEGTEALHTGVPYTVAFGIDVVPLAEGIAAGQVPNSLLNSPEPADQVSTLTVQLDTDDFEISEHSRPLRVPRAGRSLNKARFEVVPLHDGRGTLIATLHRDGNFIHQLTIELHVGRTSPTLVSSRSMGRAIAAAELHQRRDLGLVVEPRGNSGYECRVIGRTADHASLPITVEQLSGAVDALRAAVGQVIDYRLGAGYPFSDGIDIPAAAEQFALTTLARAGARLFQQIFFHPAGGEEGRRIGEGLRRMATDPQRQLKLQVVSQGFAVPWPLLYLGDVRAGATLDWDLFLGMRHLIECIPFQDGFPALDTDIASTPQLKVGVNLNTAIDEELRGDFVACQQTWWTETSRNRLGVQVVPRSRRAEVLDALASIDCADQIFYLYCHAVARGPRDAGGVDASALQLTDGRLTLGELNLDAPTDVPLLGNPLVFVNACESAELSPLFYDGFVPYFMAKGARGVVGTECKVPAVFATEWARRFFDRFLDGEPLGDVVLGLRREFRTAHRNPLGLIYAVYCDNDTAVAPALHRQAG